MDILLRSPLHSSGYFDCSMSPTFLEGFLKLSGFFSNCSHVNWIICPVQYCQGYLLLLPGRLSSDRLSGGASVGSCFSLSSMLWQGLQSSWPGLVFNSNWRPGKSAPFFSPHILVTEKVFMGFISFYPKGFVFAVVFTRFMWGGEYNIEAIE